MVRSIKLAYRKMPIATEKNGSKDAYQVIIVKNSTLYSPGEVLNKDEVDDLCDGGRWEVVIVGATKKEE
jgi:hypothetical protein